MDGILTTLKRLADTIKHLGNITGSPKLYEKIFELSAEIFSASSCSILLIDPATGTLSVAAAAGGAENGVAHQTRVNPGHGAVGRALVNGEVQLAGKTIGDKTPEDDAQGVLSEVIIPLREQRDIIGVLKMESREASFGEEYLPLFTLFGEQVAASISQLRLSGRLDERARKLASISRAGQLLSTGDTGRDLLYEMLEQVASSLNPDGCSVQLLDKESGDLVVSRAHGICSDYKGVQIPGSQSIPGLAATTRRPSLVPDASKSDKKISILPDYLSEIAVPIIHRGDVLGVLHLVHRFANVFEETDLLYATIFADQMAGAISLGKVFADNEQLNARQSLLEATSDRMIDTADSGSLLSPILELVQEKLEVQHVSLLVPEPLDPFLRVFLAHDAPAGTSQIRVPIDESITGEVYRTARSLLIPDVGQEPRYIPGMQDGQSEIAVPLKVDGEVIGVLNVESASRLTKDHLKTLNLVAAQVAMMLDKAQMKNRLKVWQRQLDALNKAAQTLNSVSTLDELIQNILDIAVDALNLDRSALLLVNSRGEDLVVEAERGYGADVKGMRIAVGEGITGAVASIGEPILVADTTRDDRYVDSGVNGRCEMAVPLKVQGRVIGVLDSEGAAPGAFDQYDLDVFSAFAAQAATAVHSTRLLGSLEEANHRLEENVTEMVRMNTELTNYSKKVFRINESLESQLKNLTTIHEAGKTITSSLDLDHTLNTILEMTSQIIGSTAGAIKLLDEETNEFRVRAKSGTLSDVSAMSTVFEVPLEIGDKQIGIFQLVLKAQNGVGKGERRMVETLASQAAIAIENARLFENTQQIYYDTLKSLARALEARDDYTRGHSERVADLAKQMGEDLGLESQEVQTIYNAALLHDIGKIGIRDEVLLAPRKLTEDEMNIIKDHSAFGNTILMPLKFLSNIRECVRHHHERWDGTGYPDGKKGEEIPLASRIIAVADAYDAMTSNRPYRTSISHPVALEKIRGLAGTQFDPKVVDSFMRIIS